MAVVIGTAPNDEPVPGKVRDGDVLWNALKQLVDVVDDTFIDIPDAVDAALAAAQDVLDSNS